jgi:hypothetical protein
MSGAGSQRMLCALIGLAAACSSRFRGLVGAGQLSEVTRHRGLVCPLGQLSWSFDVALAAVAVLASLLLKAVGTIRLPTNERPDWVRPDAVGDARVLADGVSAALAGVAGAVGTNTSTPSVGWLRRPAWRTARSHSQSARYSCCWGCSRNWRRCSWSCRALWSQRCCLP